MFVDDRKGRFYLPRIPPEGAQYDERTSYRIRLEKALIVSLAVMTLIFCLSRRRPPSRLKAWRPGYNITSYELIPVTRQGGIPRPPDRPVVPIPTEDELLPEDETIEITDLDLFEDIPLFDPDRYGRASRGFSGITPRPVHEKIPEYPRSERRKGKQGRVLLDLYVNQEGIVDSVVVVENTTGSRLLLESAVQAAYASRYRPATRGGIPVPFWFKRLFKFETD